MDTVSGVDHRSAVPLDLGGMTGPDDGSHHSAEQHFHGKPAAHMRDIGTSLEPATMELGVQQTPVEQFFVCSGSPAPVVDPDQWRLRLDGDAATSAVELTVDDLAALPQQTVHSWLECAGNGRAMYELAGGYVPAPTAADTPWILGAMGMAVWTGPTLASVLELAGVDPKARWVGPCGLDVDNNEGEAAAMCLPLDKALHPDTIVATTMNGQPLLAAHGAPARLAVPGWVGAYWVKWLDHIEISTDWIGSWRADVYYRRRLADGTDLGPATTHPVKSCLALPWPAEIKAGDQTGSLEPLRLRGYARCGSSPIARVEWSADDGPWQDAELATAENLEGQWAWQPFSFQWSADPGEHQIRTRAYNAKGDTQPDRLDFHPNTVLWNAVTRHPVTVTG